MEPSDWQEARQTERSEARRASGPWGGSDVNTIEERLDTATTAACSYLWGERPRHRDELAFRDRDCPSLSANDLPNGFAGGNAAIAAKQSNGNGTLDERLYATMDYFNGTAIQDTTAAVVERYAYSAFGIRRVMVTRAACAG
jgi:hypothetical protein